MPSKTYYLDDARTEQLTVKWGFFFRNTEVFYNGQSLGVVPSTAALKAGYSYILPTGQNLVVQLQRSQGMQELALRLDGQAVPGSATHPRERLKQALYTLLFVGGLNFLLGLVAEVQQSETLLLMGLGWGSLVEGLLYAGLGWWGYARLAPVAFGIAFALLVLDGGYAIWASLQTSGSATSGLIVRFFFCVLVYRGIQAARQLRAEKQAALGQG
jgi:hypothetical protein